VDERRLAWVIASLPFAFYVENGASYRTATATSSRS
jgi:hypothetical protein